MSRSAVGAAGARVGAGGGKRLRRAWMGMSTVLGVSRQGFFAPYRYAEGVAAPGPYPVVEAAFEAARPAFEAVFDAMADQGDALRAIGAAPPPAPRWTQSWFPGLDGAAAYALTRTRAPRRIVEVGSGHSTRFFARAIADGGLATQLTAIDPAPRAALQGLDVDWRRGLLDEAAHGALFDALAPGDIAFFDSSHLLHPGTDVDIILNRILPRLRAGVLVHIHDVFLPDPYPQAWAWRGYNEQNALGPLIAAGGFRPVFASWYARTRLADRSPAVVPAPPAGAFETSLWLERV